MSITAAGLKKIGELVVLMDLKIAVPQRGSVSFFIIGETREELIELCNKVGGPFVIMSKDGLEEKING